MLYMERQGLLIFDIVGEVFLVRYGLIKSFRNLLYVCFFFNVLILSRISFETVISTNLSDIIKKKKKVGIKKR